jgi:hypothetical protein
MDREEASHLWKRIYETVADKQLRRMNQMNLITLSRIPAGRMYNAIKNEDGTFTNPPVQFQGFDLEELPQFDAMRKFIGDEDMVRLAALAYNEESFDNAKDPFSQYVPKSLDAVAAKKYRTALINLVTITGKSPEDVASLISGVM